jgi:enoyl-CoA hydratase/carnithine racemase
MAVTVLDDYRNKYAHIRFERDEQGILLVQFHSEGSDLIWGLEPHEDIASAWDDIGRDPENRVIIVTGTGETFIHKEVLAGDGNWVTPEIWTRLHHVAKRLILSHLDIEVPMIAAVNGHATVHNEQALMCDIVLSSEDALWADHPHMPSGVIPGDGIQIIWPYVIGFNRGRYLLLTGQELTAQQAMEYGAVNEVLPKDQVLPRAYELARELAAKPTLTLRGTRMQMVHELKRIMGTAVSMGMMTEGLAGIDFWPDQFYETPTKDS